MESPSGKGDRLQRDARTSELLDELDSIEHHLDPQPSRRGQRIADLVIVAVILVATLVFDLELKYPIYLFTLLVGARLTTRALRSASNRSLHRERDQLLVADANPEDP